MHACALGSASRVVYLIPWKPLRNALSHRVISNFCGSHLDKNLARCLGRSVLTMIRTIFDPVTVKIESFYTFTCWGLAGNKGVILLLYRHYIGILFSCFLLSTSK